MSLTNIMYISNLSTGVMTSGYLSHESERPAKRFNRTLNKMRILMESFIPMIIPI